ncbi:MAG: type II toxin-antitoxin system VapC family toxin [Verrucomicrobiota bacterium]
MSSSSYRYLLDTNILSALLKQPRGAVYSKVVAAGELTVCTSIVSASELYYGWAKIRSDSLKEKIDRLLSYLPILPFKSPQDLIYGELRAELVQRGKPLGPNDLFIATQALEQDLTLVTANEREFSQVQGLRLNNWLKET